MHVKDETRLARQLIDTAAQTMATLDGTPATERVIKEYREAAKVVAASILARLAGSKTTTGLFPRGGLEAQALQALADEMGKA